MSKFLINISNKQAFMYAAFLVLYEFITYIANDMIMPGMIHVIKEFNAPPSNIASGLSAYLLGGSSLQLLLGPISDRYGRRPTMLFGAMFFFLCTIAIIFSHSIEQFLMARFFQGMGLCFIVTIGYATLQEIFKEMDAIRLIAVMANISILSPLIGPLLGAFFIHYYSWRIIFILLSILALIALWGLWRFMPELIGQIRLDYTIQTPTALSPSIIISNYNKLWLNHSFSLGAIAQGVIWLPCMAWIGLSPIMLVINAKLSMLQYGLWQLPVFGALISGNTYLHRLSYRKTLKQLIRLGSWLATLALLLVYISTCFAHNNFLWLMPGLILYFFAMGIISAPLSRFILFSTNVSKGSAAALMSVISMLIQVAGLELASKLYHNNLDFGILCALTALVYSISLAGCLFKPTKI